MDKAAALACALRYAEEVAKELKPEKVAMLGSYATGHAHEDSDIDVAVIFNGFEGDFLRVSSWLWSLSWKVDSHIEPILLDRADDRSGFVEEVLKTSELIYQQ